MQTVKLSEVLKKVDEAIKVKDEGTWEITGVDMSKVQRENAQLLVLAFIAQSLDNLVKNGLMIERP